MKRHILIPTDFSDNAWNALNYAVHLYKETKCTFYLLNAYQVFDFPSEILLPMNPVEARFAMAKKVSETGLQKLLDKLGARDDNPLHQFVTLSVYDGLLNAVRSTVKEKKIDLIIMGTRGESNHSIMDFGSNAVELMENIRQCPVMAIPQKTNVFIRGNKKEIVFSTNYKTSYMPNDLDFLVQTAELLSAEIRVLHIQENGGLSPQQLRNRERIGEFLKEVRHSFHTLSHTRVASGIQSFMQSRGSDLLVMIHKKHGFFNSIFKLPMVEQMNGKNPVPLLVMH